jgi:predicted nucleic acid-binding protein
VRAYVLDASVAAKWFLPSENETFLSEALALLEAYTRGDVKLIVPDLFWPEFGNILWKATRVGRISHELAEDALKSLTGQKIPTSLSLPLMNDAFAIATRFQCTVYDSLYVALALESGKPLITADERLANSLAARFPVRWLGSFNLGPAW